MALKCEGQTAIPPDELPPMPLFPGQRQRWVVALHIGANASEEEAEERLTHIFQRWTEIIPGAIGDLEFLSTDDAPRTSIVEPPALGLREPSRLMAVEFDYHGQADQMRWPTYVLRRRERIHYLCPYMPTDTMPLVVERPERENDGDDLLPPRPNPNVDPYDAGLGPVDVDDLKWKLKLGGAGLAMAFGAGVAIVLLLRRGK